MAFPTLTAQSPTVDDATGGGASGGDTAAASHDVDLPATVAAGDLLLVFGRVAVAGAVAVTGGGWTIVQDSSDASDDVTFWGYRNTLAVGNEDGGLITVTHGNGKMAAYTMAVAGAADPATQAPQSSTVAIGTTTTVNPTACTPTGGAKDYLWIWFGGWDGEQTLSKTAPTNYTDQPDISTGTGGAVTINVQIKTARRALNAASEDPGACGTLSVAPAGWTAWTIAVHPAGAVAVTGTVARTQANQTSAASGTVVPPAVTGTIAETQDGQTSAAAGGETFTGTVARTQASQTSTASGTVTIPPVTGTLARTQASQTSAAAGAVVNPVTGTVARTQAGQTSSASGDETFTGTVARTQAGQTVAATGVETFNGALTRTQANQAAAVAGTVANPVTGTLAGAQGNQTSTATGNSGPLEPTGTLARTQANQTSAASGVESFPGALARTQAAQTAAAAGVVANPVIGALARTQAGQTSAAAGKETMAGTVIRTQAAHTLTAAGLVITPVAGTLARAQDAQTLAVVAFVGEFETPAIRTFTIPGRTAEVVLPPEGRSLVIPDRRTLNIPVEPR